MSVNHYSGIGCMPILFFIFLVLKLIGKIDWSWWWVTAPLWVPGTLALLVIISILIAYIIFTKGK